MVITPNTFRGLLDLVFYIESDIKIDKMLFIFMKSSVSDTRMILNQNIAFVILIDLCQYRQASVIAFVRVRYTRLSSI
jgi:mRNA deadenylase 3'-5' endonuclease subunit Ccr4